MMRFAEVAAPYFDSVEIVEYHHDNKIDAPSGTAAATAERIAASRAAAGLDPIEDPTIHERHRGSRGAVGPGGVHIHAVRMRGMVAHQEVILGGLGQTLTLRQDNYDRTGFMPGVVLACTAIFDHPGLTVGLEAYLGI
jgi:4-hydroxy-tetrahydrodipicolinate reductase